MPDDASPVDGVPTSPTLARRLAAIERDLAGVRAALQRGAADSSAENPDKDELTDRTEGNAELQAALHRQRSLSDDLQNILYSTNIATIFLDASLNIRFFTPATQSVFAIVPGDVGRPLTDLPSLVPGSTLAGDTAAVLASEQAQERDVEAPNGAWYRRRIMPYRTEDNRIEGVVITFTDITQRKQAASALEAAKLHAEQASLGKSRFLAAASHDLRQPLQTLSLLQGLLAKATHGERARGLLVRVDDMLNAMSGMLDRLAGINAIETGAVGAKRVSFDMNRLLARMREEFTTQAQAKGLQLRVMPCSLQVFSDPDLLEQILRNLLSNALRYTARGKILLGCRRCGGGAVRVEVWDTGMGIPNAELHAIFEEYHQLDNAARERSRGLGLGLSIVNRLANLLDHPVHVRSAEGRGSVFAVEIGCPPGTLAGNPPSLFAQPPPVAPAATGAGMILAVEDDPDMRELIGLLLESEGYPVVTAADGVTALDLAARGAVSPDLLLADYNLPNGISGLDLAVQLRALLGRTIPVIVLTGDVSADTLRDVVQQGCVQLNKPVKHQELTGLIKQLLGPVQPAVPALQRVAAGAKRPHSSTVFVVDDDAGIRAALCSVLDDDGRNAECFGSGEEFLAKFVPCSEACLLVDGYLPGMDGVELLRRLRQAGHVLPAIMITGKSDVSMAVAAMKAGAADFIEKPVGRAELLASIDRAMGQARDATKLTASREEAATHVAGLTPRQMEVMAMVLAGNPSKNIAADLGISQRTVENHRASIMRKTGAASLPALARLALAADWNGAGKGAVPC